MQQIADSIPHEYRQKILLQWLPDAKADLSIEAFKNLWDAFFIYIDPDGVRKPRCQICKNNVLKNWRKLKMYLVISEKNYDTLEQLET